MIMKMRIALAGCLLLILFPVSSHGAVWNLVDDFSIAQNPNGTWSYGWRATPQEPLNIYAERTIRCGDPQELESWDHYIEDYCPRVTRNPQDYPVNCDDDVFASHTVNFHPGPEQQSVVRWTAPVTLEATLTAHFLVISSGSSIVHIYHNGSELFSATLDYFGETADYSATIPFLAGDRLDFAVDPISFYGDSIELDVVLDDGEPTPVQPTTWGRIKAGYR